MIEKQREAVSMTDLGKGSRLRGDSVLAMHTELRDGLPKLNEDPQAVVAAVVDSSPTHLPSPPVVNAGEECARLIPMIMVGGLLITLCLRLCIFGHRTPVYYSAFVSVSEYVTASWYVLFVLQFYSVITELIICKSTSNSGILEYNLRLKFIAMASCPHAVDIGSYAGHAGTRWQLLLPGRNPRGEQSRLAVADLASHFQQPDWVAHCVCARTSGPRPLGCHHLPALGGAAVQHSDGIGMVAPLVYGR